MVGWMLLWLACGTGGNGRAHGIVDHVDLIELNHLHDDSGKPTIEQVIFWEWSPEFRRYDVIAWRLIEGDVNKLPFQLPGGQWCVRWYDRDGKVSRDVRSHIFRETWSTKDPERANKMLVEQQLRSSLRQLNTTIRDP